MKIKKIIFPTDFTESSLYALNYAVDMAQCNNSKIYLVHVIYDLSSISGLYVPHMPVEAMYKELEVSALKELEKFGVEAREGIKDTEYTVLHGVPYEEILRFSEEKEADIIIIGTHGRKGLDRVLFGSTAERIVRNAACPVLTVRNPH